MDEFRAGALMWLRENRRTLAERHPNRWIAVYEEPPLFGRSGIRALSKLGLDPAAWHRTP